jgi:RNA-directed DNA polymerase
MKAEMPERPREGGGGTAEVPGSARQAVAACDGTTGSQETMTIEEVLRRENMLLAYQRVKRNKGSAGVDGMTVDELMPYLRSHWARIREEIREGRYQPQPVLLVEIPKPGGRGMRRLGIPTVVDRMIQQALLQVLQPQIDPSFSESSYGFRPGRSAHQAVERAREHVRAGYRWVVDMDLEKFFDRVNHDILMSLVARRVKDKRILLLIRRYLQAGLMSGGVVSQRAEGTPQGGPLSPLLSNVLLDELDRELERRGHRFVRYADDCNIYVRSRRAGERVLASVETFLRGRLRLTVNRDKSAVDRPWKRKFLGYTMTAHAEPKLRVAPESVKRLRDKVRELARQGRGRSLGWTVERLEPIIRGWVAYFQLAEAKAAFEELDQWLRRRLRCILWRQWKRPRTRAMKLMKLGLERQRAFASASNGHGPWWNAGASHMNRAVPTRYLKRCGLLSFLEEHQRLQRQLRTAVYGTVRTVV